MIPAEERIDMAKIAIRALRAAQENTDTLGNPANEVMKNHSLGVLAVIDAALDGDIEKAQDIVRSMELRFRFRF